MKTLLLFCCLLPICTNAQSIRLSILGGASSISAPSGQDAGKFFYNDQTVVNSIGMLRAEYLFKRVSAGLDISVGTMARKDPDYPFFGPSAVGTQWMYVATPGVIVTPSLSFKAGRLSFGPQVGVLFGKGKDDKPNIEGPGVYYSRSGAGFVAGLHLSYHVPIIKHFGLSVDGRGNYISMRAKQGYRDDLRMFNFFQYSGTVGLSYTW